MNRKNLAVLLIIFTAVLGLSFSPVSADNDKSGNNSQDGPPQIDGIYDVPGRPDLKVRVFVHQVKPAKPGKPEPISNEVCGLSDNNSPTDLVAYAGWKLPSAINYYLNLASVPASVGSANFAAIAENSFDAWSGAAGVSASLAGETSLARAVRDNQWIIAWGNTTALGVTYIWYNSITEEVVELDTILNKKYFWKWSDPASASWSSDPICAYSNAYDAQNILTHEIGHWFGLDDHYTAAFADHTMYGYGSKQETKKDTPTAGGIGAIDNIY